MNELYTNFKRVNTLNRWVRLSPIEYGYVQNDGTLAVYNMMTGEWR